MVKYKLCSDCNSVRIGAHHGITLKRCQACHNIWYQNVGCHWCGMDFDEEPIETLDEQDDLCLWHKDCLDEAFEKMEMEPLPPRFKKKRTRRNWSLDTGGVSVTG